MLPRIFDMNDLLGCPYLPRAELGVCIAHELIAQHRDGHGERGILRRVSIEGDFLQARDRRVDDGPVRCRWGMGCSPISRSFARTSRTHFPTILSTRTSSEFWQRARCAPQDAGRVAQNGRSPDGGHRAPMPEPMMRTRRAEPAHRYAGLPGPSNIARSFCTALVREYAGVRGTPRGLLAAAECREPGGPACPRTDGRCRSRPGDQLGAELRPWPPGRCREGCGQERQNADHNQV